MDQQTIRRMRTPAPALINANGAAPEGLHERLPHRPPGAHLGCRLDARHGECLVDVNLADPQVGIPLHQRGSGAQVRSFDYGVSDCGTRGGAGALLGNDRSIAARRTHVYKCWGRPSAPSSSTPHFSLALVCRLLHLLLMRWSQRDTARETHSRCPPRALGCDPEDPAHRSGSAPWPCSNGLSRRLKYPRGVVASETRAANAADRIARLGPGGLRCSLFTQSVRSRPPTRLSILPRWAEDQRRSCCS